MPDPAPAAPPAPAPAAPAAGAPPPPASTWYTGIESEVIGHWDNKGWDKADPKTVALAATKQARELERHFGVPPEQLLRMPKADAPEADLKAFYQRLGAPADPKDYDFSAVKFNGEPLDDAFQMAMRAALSAAYVPKDKAATVTAGVVKFLEDAEKAEATETAGKIAMEQAALKTQWGQNFDFNRLKAMEGARRVGITPEGVAALENQIGYSAVMEVMRKIGMVSSEAAFVDSGATTGGNPVTQDGAAARVAELRADPVFRQRLLSGDVAANRELHRLVAQVEGETPLY